jgi:hypothetical protein
VDSGGKRGVKTLSQLYQTLSNGVKNLIELEALIKFFVMKPVVYNSINRVADRVDRVAILSMKSHIYKLYQLYLSLKREWN